MAADDPKFTCTACGKEYRWKPELAGRKAKCGCGAALVVPAERPAGKVAPVENPAAPAPSAAAAPLPVGPVPEAPTAADLKPSPASSSDAKCPVCGAALAAHAVLC